MSETNFTKGEWWVNPVGQYWENPDMASYEICWSEDRECVVDHVYELADAHLIAAAPKMYGMLEYVMKSAAIQDNELIDAEEIRKLLSEARGEKSVND